MTEPKILIVSDHQESAHLWAHGLNQRSIPTVAVKFDTNVLEKSISSAFDLIAIDINEFGHQVLSICRRARSVYDGPILLCTYERDERFHLQAYEAGIDECISKPIGNLLFLAKVLSWLRGSSMLSVSTNEQRYPDFQLDGVRRVLTMQEGSVIKLSYLELRLLLLLISNKGRVVGPNEIIAWIWPDSAKGNIHLIKSLVYRLRQKIEPIPSRPRYIETVAGLGYRFRSRPRRHNLM